MERIPARLVKQLREMTGARMMDCKQALIKSQGDIEGAIGCEAEYKQAATSWEVLLAPYEKEAGF